MVTSAVGKSVALCAVLLLASGVGQSADKAGAKDHPLISRYEGSEIIGYLTSTYDSYLLTTKPSTRILDTRSAARGLSLEGAYSGILYAAPAGRSTLEVFANYRSALQRGGFQTLWSCSTDCGVLFATNQARNAKTPGTELTWYDAKDTRYLAAKLARPGGDVYVAVLTANSEGHTRTMVEVLETKAMETGKVLVDAGELRAAIARDGKVALYAVYFDTDQATLKSESRPQLEEIAKLLQGAADLSVFIVGHTDGVGTLEHNMDLAKRRAETITNALVTDYHVAKARLTARGVGPLAPIASNRDEAGRAKNRRVEVVERMR